MADANTIQATGLSAASGNGHLDLEKPLARMEHEIARLEAQQGESNRDLSTEIKRAIMAITTSNSTRVKPNRRPLPSG